MVQWVKNLTAAAQVAAEALGLIPSPVQQVKGSSIATATEQVTAAARIHSLAWELPYTIDAAIKNRNNMK